MFHQFSSFGTSQNSLIKCIAEVEISIASGSTSNTATLSATVDKNKSIIFWQGTRTPTDAPDQAQIAARVELTDGDTVTATVNSVSSVSAARIVRATVVEFYPWVIEGNVDHATVAIDSGQTVGVGGAADYLTVSNSGRAGRVYLGATTTATGDSKRINTAFARLEGAIDDSYSVVAIKGSTTGAMVAGVCQWIWAQGVIKARAFTTVNITAGNASNAVTLSGTSPSVLANCLTVWCGTTYSDGFTEHNAYLYQNSATQVTGVREQTTGQATIEVLVFEFLSKWVGQGKQAAQTTFTAGQATEDVTITAIKNVGGSVPAKNLTNYLHFTIDNAFGSINYVMNTVKTQSSTAIRHERGTGTDFGNVPVCSMEAFEFR